MEPSARKALDEKNRITPLRIPDTNKHQYISCVGSSDGGFAATEMFLGGIDKEVSDIYDKVSDSKQRKAYGGIGRILQDSAKDIKNNILGISYGLSSNTPESCNILLQNPISWSK